MDWERALLVRLLVSDIVKTPVSISAGDGWRCPWCPAVLVPLCQRVQLHSNHRLLVYPVWVCSSWCVGQPEHHSVRTLEITNCKTSIYLIKSITSSILKVLSSQCGTRQKIPPPISVAYNEKWRGASTMPWGTPVLLTTVFFRHTLWLISQVYGDPVHQTKSSPIQLSLSSRWEWTLRSRQRMASSTPTPRCFTNPWWCCSQGLMRQRRRNFSKVFISCEGIVHGTELLQF